MRTFLSNHGRGHFLLVFQKVLLFSVLNVFYAQTFLFTVVSAVPNGPRFSPLIPPPQVLLPPHRESDQSLDDIIYGTSFSGSALLNNPFASRFPVDVPRPSISTSSPPPPPPSPPVPPSFNPSQQSFFAGNSNTIFSKPVILPSQPRNLSNRPTNNINLVQTFTPPSPPPPPPPSSTAKQFVFPSSSPSIPFRASAEEIKLPQTLKIRTPRKQYSKADLIAAANSIKPAGFDFNKVLIVTHPSNNNLNGSGNEATSIYKQVMLPLPLFDTPVYNQLRPLMEMLMRAGKFDVRGGSTNFNDNNKKVLVIIPKSSGSNNNANRNLPFGRSATSPGVNNNPLLNNNKQSVKHQLQSSATTTTTSSKSAPASKFILPKVPTTRKYTTTAKPKQFSQRFPTTTKQTIKTRSSLPTKVPLKKSDRGPDLQAAATSNKCEKTNFPIKTHQFK